ncbi:Xyloglucan endotransglucosylase/hydrolase protein 2 [Sesamum alatum]|uniref:Xyloglucan endotransglucosylase/hydrolase n=1 Tax=Sesamum alatum TaxID=300844 RepID=A0AAE2CMH5_9LAMI|nr:Xyloglucan endotransglucosylase/hydrolase protein 2 [Sesamum alatum]
MDFRRLSFLVVVVVIVLGVVDGGPVPVPFNVSYNVAWGNDHVLFLDQGRQVQLSMDLHSGAGFESKLSYGSGFFHLRIKLPNRDSAGVITAFYLRSKTDHHDELDFEFLGNKEGKPITLQTNVFANGQGDREQRFHLWFDPTADFHTYKILWNEHQIVFYVDNIPIRVFKNNTKIGVMYPAQAMQIEATLWDGDSWATDGGRTKTNWSCAPFTANFRGFNVDGCALPPQSSDDDDVVRSCYDSKYWWNQSKFWKLGRKYRQVYEQVRNKYMNYDYCDDRSRHPVVPPECASNGGG